MLSRSGRSQLLCYFFLVTFFPIGSGANNHRLTKTYLIGTKYELAKNSGAKIYQAYSNTSIIHILRGYA